MRPRITQAFVVAIFMACACMMRAHAAETPPTNVEIDVSFVSFELKDIEKIARKTVGAAPTQEQIRKAWMAGKGKLLATNKVIGQSGEQTKIEGVLEKIYPTEYEEPRVAGCYSTPPPNVHDPRPTAGGYNTRNAGCIVNLTPMASEHDNFVNVTLIPELSEFTGWNRIEVGQAEGSKKVTAWVQQPDFQVRRTTTSLIVPLDGTIVTGGVPDAAGKTLTYFFVTARKAHPDALPFVLINHSK